jgi:hypothetical protein
MGKLERGFVEMIPEATGVSFEQIASRGRRLVDLGCHAFLLRLEFLYSCEFNGH